MCTFLPDTNKKEYIYEDYHNRYCAVFGSL